MMLQLRGAQYHHSSLAAAAARGGGRASSSSSSMLTQLVNCSLASCRRLSFSAIACLPQLTGQAVLQQEAIAAVRAPRQHELLRRQQPLRTAVAAAAASLAYRPPACSRINRHGHHHHGAGNSSSRRLLCSSSSTNHTTAAATQPLADCGGEPPLIVTASWLGAKKRPFSKYKALWQSLGAAAVLSARPPITSIMFPLQGQLAAAAFTHRLLDAAARHPQSPILVHLFSGGGFIYVGWVFQLLAELRSPEADALRARVAGVVLDSSPATVDADVSSRALVAAVLGRPADGIESALPWLVRPAAAIVAAYLRLPFVRDALVAMDDAWLAAAPRCPLLFLYSDADVLTRPDVVEAFMASQQARGSDTYSHKWADSGHVDHFRVYPTEYRQQLAAFATKALQQYEARRGRGGGCGGDGSSVDAEAAQASPSSSSSSSSSLSSSSSVSGLDIV